MSWIAGLTPAVTYFVLACVVALMTLSYVLLAPRPVRLAVDRRRPAIAAAHTPVGQEPRQHRVDVVPCRPG